MSNGTNTTACPVTPDWQPTGTYQCVSGTGGFATGERQQQQHDNNPYSNQGNRWVSVGTNYTACPLVPSYTNTGNARCVTNTGYNTGVQEVELHDVNPYTGHANQWVYGSVNYSACPVQEDWVNTGGYICIQGSGNYKTGDQDVEQYDQNPVTRAGYRWVSGGQNTSACPVTPDWSNTSNYRCVTNSGYNTGQQERQQYDQNPYSGQGYRWVNVGSSTACPVTPDWVNQGSPVCEMVTGVENTGYQLQKQYDQNPYSANGYRWVNIGQNLSACPLIVYVQLSYENMFETFDGYVYADVKLSFYHNSAMTIPAYGDGLMINYSVGRNCGSSYDDVAYGSGEYMYLQRMAMLISPSCFVDYSLLTGTGYYLVF